MGIFVVFKVFLIFYWRVFFRVVFRLDNGLLSKIKFGLWVRVWVSVICCFWLLDKVVGFLFWNVLRFSSFI